MKAENAIDFTKIEWSKIDKEKAEFFYAEAAARLDSIHKNIDGITNKALGVLSFSLPILTALTGFFVLQWGTLSTPLIAASVCSVALLFTVLVLLLLILLPRGINSAHGGPGAYFAKNYYLGSMEDILKGNIQTVHQNVIDDGMVLNFRGNLFRAAIVIFAVFPVITAGVWAAASVCTNR